jgi:hypothetical protein
MEQVDKEQTPQKKTYTSPELISYGDIRTITQTKNAGSGNPDGGVNPMDKT